MAVSVTCTTCLSPLQFVGLPIGDGEPLDGGRVPAMSLTGTEVYLPCRPIVVAERATGGAQ